MQPRDPAGPAAEPGPLDEETHARVLDHQPSGMIQGISEKGLYLIRIRSSAGSTTHLPGTAVELENVNVLGMTRHRDLSVMAQAELHGVVKDILSDNPEVCLSLRRSRWGRNRRRPWNRRWLVCRRCDKCL